MTISVDSVHWFNVEENMLRMKQRNIQCALRTGIRTLRWLICHSWDMRQLERYIDNESQLVKVGDIHNWEPHSGLDCRSQLCLNFSHRPRNKWQHTLRLSHNYPSRVLASDTLRCRSEIGAHFNNMPAYAAALLWISEAMSHILTQVLNITYTDLIAKCDCQICCAGSVIKWLKTYTEDSLVHLNLDHMRTDVAALPRISKPVPHILTQQLHIALTDYIAKWDCDVCSTGSVAMRFIIDAEVSPAYLKVVQIMHFSFIWLQNVYMALGVRYTSNSQLINDSKCLAASWSYSTTAMYHEIDLLGSCNVAYQLTLFHIGHYE